MKMFTHVSYVRGRCMAIVARLSLFLLLAVSFQGKVFAHTVDYFNSCGYVCAGSTLTVSAHVSATNSSSKYNWQFKDNTNTWKCFVNGSNSINGVAYTVSGVSATGTLSTSPILTIANVQSSLSDVQVRLLIADGGTPCASSPSYTIWGGDKSLRLHVLTGSDCSTINTLCSTGGCTGNQLYNSDGYYGGFETGSIGAASTNYTLTTSSSSAGQYAIINNPQQVYSSFAAFAPHSGNYMMYIDGSTTAGKMAWYKTVSVVKDNAYQFSAWVANVSSTSSQKATVRLKIAGVNTSEATQTVSATAGAWSYITVSYVPSASGTVTLSISDDNIIASDNDFVLDDICFKCNGSAATLTLGNLVWLDLNGNNVKDASEPGVPNATVKLYKDDNNDDVADGAAIATTTTNASGNYTFTGLASGNYIVGVIIPAGYTKGANTSTDPDNDVDNDNNGVTLIGANQGGGEVRSKAITLLQTTEPTNDGDDNNGNLTLDFALCPAPNNLTLGNLVWLDINANNVKDAFEPVIPNATVKLYKDANNDNVADGAAIATTTTNSNGMYTFTGLASGNYIAGVIIPASYQARLNGTVDPDNDIDNDNNGVTLVGANQPGSEVRSNAITLLQTTEPTNDGDDNNGNLTLDFGMCPIPNNLTLGNLVWLDLNGNNLKDASEPGVANATVKLYADANNDNVADGAAVATTTTNSNGNYTFTGLASGNYVVGVIIPAGYTKGAASTVDPDNDVDNDNNGVNLIGANQGGGEVRSLAITLSQFTEPTNDGDDNNGNLTLDFALCPAPNNLTLGNLVWLDINANNVKDAFEPVIPNATVKLYKDANNDNVADGAAIATTTTNSNGLYTFTGLASGNYIAGVIIPASYQARLNGTVDPDNDIDNDNNGVTLVGANQPGSEVRSNAITLLQTTEPTNDGDDNNGNLTLDFGMCPIPNNLTLGNLVWLDLNGNNVKDASEPGVANATVKLYADANNDNVVDGAAVATTTTNTNGNYTFTGLAAGNYIVGVIIPTNYTRGAVSTTDPDNDVDNDNNGVTLIGANQPGGEVRSLAITLSQFTEPTNDGDDNNGNLTLDIALCPAPPLNLGNFVWNDYDGDGKKDADEPGIPNAPVSLYRDDNSDNIPDSQTPIATVYSNSKGFYSFSNLSAGRYIVSMPILPGYTQSPNNSTKATSPIPDNDIDNDNNLVNNVNGVLFTNAITLTVGGEPTTDGDGSNGNLTMDLGECGNSYVGDFVWNDLNGNGIQDAGEPGINGVLVTITFPDGTIATTTTLTYTASNNPNAPQYDGYYNFPNLGPGTYQISFATPAGLLPSPANQGGNDSKDSDPVNGSVSVTIAVNQSDFTIDAGFRSPATLSLGNLVWLDLNGNNVKESNEPGLPGTTVNLYSDVDGDNAPDGAPIATTTTGNDGSYYFNNLSAGSYIVGAVIPYSSFGFGAVGSPLPNNDVDNDNNGVRLVGNEIRTNYITLAAGTEPTADGDDNNSNSTLDVAMVIIGYSCRTDGKTGKAIIPILDTKTIVKSDMSIYPNPAVNNFSINISSEKQSAASVWITDLSGKLIMTKNLVLTPGTNLIQMNADSKMRSGVYTVQSLIDGKIVSKRLIIAR